MARCAFLFIISFYDESPSSEVFDAKDLFPTLSPDGRCLGSPSSSCSSTRLGGEDVEGPANAAAALEMFCDWLKDSDLKVPFSRVFANSCLLEGSNLWAMRTLASKSASGHMSLSIDLNFLTERSRFRARRFSKTNLARVEGSAFNAKTYGH